MDTRPNFFVLPSLLALGAASLGCTSASDSAAVFDRDKLHVIEISVDSEYLSQLETDLDNRVPATITFDGEEVEGAGIRQKGNSTEPLTGKPSFSVKLDEFAEYETLFGVQKFLLNNAKQDATFLREALSVDLFSRSGIPVSRRAHAVVKLNGSDLGIYVLAEAVDKDFLKIHFGAPYDDGNLYEGPCCEDFAVDVDHMELEDEAKDGRTRDDIRALADLVNKTPDDSLATTLDKRMDFSRFVTMFAVEAALDHWDGYAFGENNYYMYNNPEDGRFVFIPHGMDRVMQEASFDPLQTPAALLPKRMRAIPALDAKYQGELSRVMKDVWNEAAILASIDASAAVIRSASAGERTKKDVEQFNASLDALREAFKLRRVLLDPSIVCGDGVKAGLEKCDDGNTTPGDGCSATCRTEM